MKPSGVEKTLFVLLLLCYFWPIDLDSGPNVRAHMDQAAAIVADGTLSIDSFMRPPEGPNTVDWARGPDGHFYPAKAPGSAFAAVPILAVLHSVESAVGISPFTGDWFRRNTVLVNWALNSLGSALAMTLLLRLLLSAGFRVGPAVFGVLAIALGTTYYPYATTYYSHNLAANLVIAAAFCALSATPSATRDALAGLLAGFAVVFDYTAVFAVLVFAGVLAIRRPRGLLPFIAGGLVPLAVLAWYHTAVFGSPLRTAYRFLNPRIAPADGELLRVPGMSTLLSLTIAPYRGLFFYSPVLLLAVAGAWSVFRRWRQIRSRPGGVPAEQRNQDTLIWSGLVLFALWFLFNACYYTWWGGWTAGSRYVIPGLVLLAPSVAVGFTSFPKSGLALLAVSIANHVAISTVLVMVNERIKNPLFEVIYPGLWHGELERSNLARVLFGLDGLWSLAALMVPVTVLAVVLARQLTTSLSVHARGAHDASPADPTQSTVGPSKPAGTRW